MTDIELIFKFDEEDNFDDKIDDKIDLSQFDLSLKKKKKKKIVENNKDNVEEYIFEEYSESSPARFSVSIASDSFPESTFIGNDIACDSFPFGKEGKEGKEAYTPNERSESHQGLYDYVYLLDRLFNELRDKHPSLVSRKRQIIPPPILQRAGKKTMWTNFSTIVSVLKRPIDHIQSYISYEMSTECSVDGNSRLLIKGKFNSKNMETVLKKYIIEYVSCYLCKSHDTSIIKDPLTRGCFIKCDTCKSSRSVTQIKKPFRL
jgi:translation initiation factor 2 subunit 2